MATHFKYVDGRDAFKRLLQDVHENGDVRSPRGLKTYDVGYATIELLSPYNALAIGVGRNLSKRVAAAEAIQLIGGFADPQLLLQASPNFARYIEPSGEFWGAYGRRIAFGNQLPAVIGKLQQDPDTRQAIVTLWDPAQDNDPYHKDYPCTLALGFSIQRGKLELDVTMRSNDVWRGFPYDVFQFTQLQLTVANVLGLQPGRYRHHTYSLHLYADDVNEAMNCYFGGTDCKPDFMPEGLADANTPIQEVMTRAREIASLEHEEAGMTESERWYWSALHPTNG
jgi:thymidylate synthase